MSIIPDYDPIVPGHPDHKTEKEVYEEWKDTQDDSDYSALATQYMRAKSGSLLDPLFALVTNPYEGL